WDGKTYAEIHQSEPEALSAFWSNPYLHTPPQAETLARFNQRVGQAWDQLIQQAPGEQVLLVTHGGVIRQILARILELPEASIASIRRMYLPYGSRCRIEVYVDEQGQPWPRLMFPEVAVENS
ncbi:MAG: histidine phosphatase family protein, partial [Cytophagales bacterium]|nr:histidine phosphatase family protein [Cytophagales bacterium]